MRTVRNSSRLLPGGGLLQGGMPAPGGCLLPGRGGIPACPMDRRVYKNNLRKFVADGKNAPLRYFFFFFSKDRRPEKEYSISSSQYFVWNYD